MNNSKIPVLATQPQLNAGDLFISFRNALNKYCEDSGIDYEHNTAVRIIRNAAANTVYKMQTVTDTDAIKMRMYEQKIPNMIIDLMAMNIVLTRQIDAVWDWPLEQLCAVMSAKNPATAMVHATLGRRH